MTTYIKHGSRWQLTPESKWAYTVYLSCFELLSALTHYLLVFSAGNFCKQFGPPDLGPICLTLRWYSWNNCLKRLILKKKSADNKKAGKISQGNKELKFSEYTPKIYPIGKAAVSLDILVLKCILYDRWYVDKSDVKRFVCSIKPQPFQYGRVVI